jgi:putative addiction module component (TIGR02574 family)
MNMSEFNSLPNDEKLRLVFHLWDDIANSNHPIVLSENTLKEMERRSAECQSNPALAIDEDEMWRQVDGQSQ